MKSAKPNYGLLANLCLGIMEGLEDFIAVLLKDVTSEVTTGLENMKILSSKGFPDKITCSFVAREKGFAIFAQKHK